MSSSSSRRVRARSMTQVVPGSPGFQIDCRLARYPCQISTYMWTPHSSSPSILKVLITILIIDILHHLFFDDSDQPLRCLVKQYLTTAAFHTKLYHIHYGPCLLKLRVRYTYPPGYAPTLTFLGCITHKAIEHLYHGAEGGTDSGVHMELSFS